MTLKAPLPAEPVSIGYIGPDGAANGSTDALPDDHALTLARTFVVGVHGLLANDVECGTFGIEHDRETDVELTTSATGCTITTVQVHGEEVIHPDPADSTGTITGTGPAHARITLVPLNVAEAPHVVQADESGVFRFDGLLPGRYRVGLAGEPGSAREVLVAAGERAVVELLLATTPP